MEGFTSKMENNEIGITPHILTFFRWWDDDDYGDDDDDDERQVLPDKARGGARGRLSVLRHER